MWSLSAFRRGLMCEVWFYWVYNRRVIGYIIDSVDAVPGNWNTTLWENGNCFTLNFTRETSATSCLLRDSTCLFLSQNRSKVHSSGAELIRADTIPADTLSERGIIIGLRHMPFWLWIIIMGGGGRYQEVEHSERNRSRAQQTDNGWNICENSRSKKKWSVFSTCF